jgi:hypothetical protein
VLSYRLLLDGTVHEGRADRLLPGGGLRKDPPRWWNWTVANTSSTGRPRSPSRSMARSSPDCSRCPRLSAQPHPLLPTHAAHVPSPAHSSQRRATARIGSTPHLRSVRSHTAASTPAGRTAGAVPWRPRAHRRRSSAPSPSRSIGSSHSPASRDRIASEEVKCRRSSTRLMRRQVSQHPLSISPVRFLTRAPGRWLRGSLAGAEMRRREAWSQQRTISLEVFEPKACQCTVRDAPDLQKVGGEPSSRSLKCCEL